MNIIRKSIRKLKSQLTRAEDDLGLGMAGHRIGFGIKLPCHANGFWDRLHGQIKVERNFIIRDCTCHREIRFLAGIYGGGGAAALWRLARHHYSWEGGVGSSEFNSGAAPVSSHGPKAYQLVGQSAIVNCPVIRPGLNWKTIEVQIINDEEYEKNKNFFIELGQPKLLGSKIQTDYSSAVGKQEELAQQGCPCLGEHLKMEIAIEESYEFKSTVDKLIKKTSLALAVSSSSWKEQFVNAVTVSAGEDNDDGGSGEKQLPSYFDYIMHFLTVFWKVLFAFVPPTEYLNGWACFVVSIMLIGVLTTITGDLAKHFGCTIGLKNSVTAIVFVALGTSIPDTFASKVAAIQDQFADASISNVTGSNAVNVFLGIGVAWTMSAIYWASKGQPFRVDPGNLAFSVTIFTIFAFVAITTLLCRRRREIGGELGGPWLPKLCTSGFFILLWLTYIILSSLEAYCYITGF
ncbi:sodium/calcium exchanger 1-like [Mobula birostris]|uniref:sodium/calcium exchanger 1-like n=1 Tax=Mobula birostris TaxID=1983395 RepID=UPI003B28797A